MRGVIDNIESDAEVGTGQTKTELSRGTGLDRLEGNEVTHHTKKSRLGVNVRVVPSVLIGGGALRTDQTFEEAFDRLWPRCFRLARRITGNRESAEDIAADAMARLYAHWRRVSQLPWQDAWAYRVTTNLAIDATRRLSLSLDAEASVTPEDTTVVRLALAAALRALPARQRDAVTLRYLSDLNEADVANVLGLAPGTVKSHLHRGMKALRARLGDDLEETYLAH